VTSDPSSSRSLATQPDSTGPEATSGPDAADAPETTRGPDAAGGPDAAAADGQERPRGTLTGRLPLGRVTGKVTGPLGGMTGKVTGPLGGMTGKMTGPVGRIAGKTAGRWPRRQKAGKAAGPWPLGRMTSVAVAVAAVFSVLAMVIGSLALAGLSDARARVVDRLDPATFQSLRLGSALVNQETGVRGYALSAQPSFLAPYTSGLATQRSAVASLRTLLSHEPAASADLAQVTRWAQLWRSRYAQPTIQQVQTTGKPVVSPNIDQGKAAFDGLRHSAAALQADIGRARQQGVADLRHAAAVLVAVCVGIGAVLLIIVVALAVGLRMAAIRPLSRLSAEARQVAAGDFGHEVGQSGPKEVRDLGMDVNRMRERILKELSALQAAHANLEARSRDLQRSNSELEQFAYVASHDLQEPLRKVASFCQLLQRNYAGSLDERADQYIELAVDGAKRMQALINDLLSFSRVGRIAQDPVPVSCAAALDQARANLSGGMAASGATIEIGALPVVLGEEPLLVAVFQNLLSNALKFRAEQPPRIAVSARRDGETWLFSVQDNGIGIEPEFAERIFVIFQRLHGKGTYAGTGIGLAMCRKIIEYHGGRIWLDTSAREGSRFCFTLPVSPEIGERP
jgi:signal transduction histidine kinase